ncbi:FG-GAP repeat domain-containing protein [Roseobacter sinensis]|uniref:VCBS repeat-containing protein n=1 Tax=Roseobacter sinensis TaxID=2931391 RepID=A0ABT3B9Y8_9RHOB|nr:VCBS repeat-containing protein [Roseobacter sp. WL0113]MCV3270387.1 VCBS repeat-containing protein [Roseobacter sp. WL0113]
MGPKARRLPARGWRGFARRALLAACLWHGEAVAAGEITAAAYDGPTERYAHAVLGDAIEYTTLAVSLADGGERRFGLPDDLVFEDTAPRVADLDGDGEAEVIVVESSQSDGARLAIYGPDGRITATPFIGTRFRWLAPVGAADLDGDGRMELAYIDRPHLAKTLRLWRYEARQLTPLADLPGLTNHRIGETDIAGGIRTCGGAPEMILARADWAELVAVRFDASGFSTRRLGDDTSRPAFARALACDL